MKHIELKIYGECADETDTADGKLADGAGGAAGGEGGEAAGGEKTIRPALANSYFLRLRGLIGRSAKDVGGLLIVPCNQIHTFFMSEAIDVIYIDVQGCVLKIDEAVEPGRMCKAVRGAKKVLELYAGASADLGLKPGNILREC